MKVLLCFLLTTTFASGLGWVLTAHAVAHATSNPLEIHYINVGQGASTLIIGPNGTRILYDFGNKKGDVSVVPYLDSLNWAKKSLEYSILSHRDKDHFYGYKGIIEQGYDFTIFNYKPSSTLKKGLKLKTHWRNITKQTTAGEAVAIKPGLDLSLGNGASLFVVAAAGILFTGEEIHVKNENDFSISVLLSYGHFQLILDGDMGAGNEPCSSHNTHQKAVQQKVASALLTAGRIDPEFGVDIMHVSHHGSESSSAVSYVAAIKPEVAIVSVGNPNCAYRHPHQNVMDVLMGEPDAHQCESFKPLKAVFQTDVGSESCTKGSAHNTGIIGGDIIIKTDGQTDYTISTTGVLWQNNKRKQVNAPASYKFSLDEVESQIE
ncbi:hypothetical protein OE749_05645 [Aestuariibacter sp. AA17]|uniref:ComEC family competence protein n=1 Tax=Fluctibacter corallii TaxID=2984329 RepID=A0ABT3A677_9ALTE|nr:hypothetical protein [Aestuariibacter sp. AA17]MCV2884170.1 hypothetical protein [Aestuariibacter sp. AA17]